MTAFAVPAWLNRSKMSESPRKRSAPGTDTSARGSPAITMDEGSKTPEEKRLERLERLDWHLHNWRDWMRSGEHIQGYKHTAAGCVGGGHIGDFDDMVAKVDRKTAAIMDTLINDLPPTQACAVHHRWLHSVWGFPRDNFDELYSAACESLLAGMSHKGLY